MIEGPEPAGTISREGAVARNLVRDVIKGSIGYAELSRRTGTPEKSLVRMFGPNGNPTAANFSSVFAHLQRIGGISRTGSKGNQQPIERSYTEVAPHHSFFRVDLNPNGPLRISISNPSAIQGAALLPLPHVDEGLLE